MTEHLWPEETSRWLARPIKNDSAPTIFCLPQVGHGNSPMRRWPEWVGDVSLRVLHFPGDLEPSWWRSHSTFRDQALDMLADLRDHQHGRYAFFGHGTSALVVYEAALALTRSAAVEPARLFVSGCPAPVLARELGTGRTEDELVEIALRAFLESGSIPLPTHLERNLVALRATQDALLSYTAGSPAPLRTGITAIGWRDDSECRADAMKDWAERAARTEFVTLAGSHERYMHAPPELMRVLAGVASDPT